MSSWFLRSLHSSCNSNSNGFFLSQDDVAGLSAVHHRSCHRADIPNTTLKTQEKPLPPSHQHVWYPIVRFYGNLVQFFQHTRKYSRVEIKSKCHNDIDHDNHDYWSYFNFVKRKKKYPRYTIWKHCKTLFFEIKKKKKSRQQPFMIFLHIWNYKQWQLKWPIRICKTVDPTKCWDNDYDDSDIS